MTFLLALMLGATMPTERTTAERANTATVAETVADSLFRHLELDGRLARSAFIAGFGRAAQHATARDVIAIADMSQPSTARRLFVIDLRAGRVLLNTYVAHGQNSGGLTATAFSNRADSHQTSLGLYRVGMRIQSPKHGPALLLHGLDKGVNDHALAREIIIHGADYASDAFIARNGRLGRSWGCPAVPRRDMARMIALLADGGLLYVHGG
jgi:hypothetical protein